jgi:hypothetical protein
LEWNWEYSKEHVSVETGRRTMDRKTKLGVLAICCVLAIVLIGMFLSKKLPHFLTQPRGAPPPPTPWDSEWYYNAQTVISIVSIAFSIFLLAMYADSYRKTRSDVSVALMIFAVVLFLSSLTSNPALQFAFGFKAFGLGPFAMLPLLFQCIGLMILSFIALR